MAYDVEKAKFPPGVLSDEEAAAFESSISRQRTIELQVLGFSDEQLKLITLAAEKKSITAHEFVIKYAMVSAEMILLERTDFKVSDEIYDQFVAILDRPPRDLPVLRDMIAKNHNSRFKIVTTPEDRAADEAATRSLAEAFARRQDETAAPED